MDPVEVSSQWILGRRCGHSGSWGGGVVTVDPGEEVSSQWILGRRLSHSGSWGGGVVTVDPGEEV